VDSGESSRTDSEECGESTLEREGSSSSGGSSSTVSTPSPGGPPGGLFPDPLSSSLHGPSTGLFNDILGGSTDVLSRTIHEDEEALIF